MCGRTCCCKAEMAAASRRCQCSRCDAEGAGRRRQFGYIGVPPPHSAGRVGSVLVGGGLKHVGPYGTLGSYRQVPGRWSRVT